MKLKIIFKSLIVLSIILSCNNENNLENVTTNNFMDIELLKEDKRFINLIELNLNYLSDYSKTNIEVARKLTSKEKLSDNEINELAISLGFKNKNHYQDYIDFQNKILKELNEDYNLLQFEQGFFVSLVIETFNINSNNNQKLNDCNCSRIRRNCLLEVSAVALTAHLACASVDWTGIGAPVCHGAAIVYQIAAGDTCNANYENCKEECIPQ